MGSHTLGVRLAAGLFLLVFLGACSEDTTPLRSPSPALVDPSANPSSTQASGLSGSAAVESSSPATEATRWHRTARMISPHTDGTATLLPNGLVLMAGGGTASNDDVSAAAELFDPTSGTWTATGNMTQARREHTATLLQDGRVLVVGGTSSDHELASADLYDPTGGHWTEVASLHHARSGHTATLLPDGRVLVAGGYDVKGAALASLEMMGRSSAELYDPRTGEWTPTGRMTDARAGSTATLLPDGEVLVAGGDMGGATGAELYDPATGRWTATGSMADARRDHTATLLPDGRVLVTGGFAGSGYTVEAPCSGPPAACSAELYDPSTGRWTATGGMHADRIGHAANLLLDGTVLIVGVGTRAAPVPTELYEPGSGRWTATASPSRTRGLTATLLADGRVLATGDFNKGRVAELYEPGTP